MKEIRVVKNKEVFNCIDLLEQIDFKLSSNIYLLNLINNDICKNGLNNESMILFDDCINNIKLLHSNLIIIENKLQKNVCTV